YKNLAQLRAAVATFVPIYNHHWRLEKLHYQSPVEARIAFQSTMPLAAPKYSCPVSNQPGAVQLIFELVPLALQTDSTRVITSSFRAAVTCRSWTA
ncbi:MAG: hypothetical protein NTV08_04925, partial [Verrucomicrobia bacterium]|nr:hypothetical protein [Verrucomicrobiota bacterium]